MTKHEQAVRGAMNQAPRHRSRAVRLGVVGFLALALISVFLLAYGRRAGAAFGDVMQDIGELDPLTHRAPRGSVVTLGSDTVAIIERIGVLGDSNEHRRLYQGRWLEQTPNSIRLDTLLEGYVHAPEDSLGPVMIHLGPRTATDVPPAGRLLLEPGAGVITVRRGT